MERQRFVYLRILSTGLIFGLIAFIIYAFNYKYKETIFLSGKVTSETQSLLIKSPISAKIENVLVSTNSLVSKNSTLIEFDCSEIDLEIQKIRYDLEKLNQYITLTDKDISYQQNLAQLNLKTLNEYNDIYSDLAEQGAVSTMQSKEFTTKVQIANIESLQRLSDLKKRLLELNQSKNTSENDLSESLRNSKNCNFVSPSNGTISEVLVRPGELIEKGTKMLRLFRESSPAISFNLPSQFVENIQIGQSFDVRVSSYPYQKYGSMRAVVSTISPVTSEMIQDNKNPSASDNKKMSAQNVFLVEAKITKLLEPLKTNPNEFQPILKNGMPIVALFQSTDKRLVYILSDQFIKIQKSIEAMRSRF